MKATLTGRAWLAACAGALVGGGVRRQHDDATACGTSRRSSSPTPPPGESVRRQQRQRRRAISSSLGDRVQSAGLRLGRQQRHVDARRSTTATACRSRWSWRFPTGTAGEASPTGIVFNGARRLLGHAGRHRPAPSAFIFAGEAGTIAGWSPAVDIDQRGHRRRRRRRRARCTRGSRIAQRTAAATSSTRPTSTTARVDVFDATSRRSTLPAASSTRTCRRATRRSASRRIGSQHLRHLREAGRRRRGRRRRAPASATSTCTTPTARFVSGWSRRRPAQRAVGHGDGAGRLRHVQQRRCSSATSATARSTPTIRRPALSRHADAIGNGDAIAIDGPVGHRVRQRRQRPADQHAVLHGRPGRRDARRLRPHRRSLRRISRRGWRATAAPAAASRARPSARPAPTTLRRWPSCGGAPGRRAGGAGRLGAAPPRRRSWSGPA